MQAHGRSQMTERRQVVCVTVAVFAMLLQVMFTTAHLSAMAVAAVLGGPTGERLGFMHLCTAQGLTIVNFEQTAGDTPEKTKSGGNSCAICGAVAAGSHLGAVGAGPLPISPLLVQVAKLPNASSMLRTGGLQLSGPTRGPPASLHA